MRINFILLVRKARAWNLQYLIIFILVLIQVKYEPFKYEDKDPEDRYVQKHLRKYLRPIRESDFAKNTDISLLTRRVVKRNIDQEVFNWQRFGSVNRDTTVFIVQVHRDVKRLQFLVVSLAQVHNIETILLVFSHSYYDSSINELIKSIDFCKVLQIFFPFSLQLFPNSFPGVDAKDCKPNSNEKDCLNRDARLLEHKQHWWWMANMVFSNMPWSNIHKGTVVFIQENDYILPDMLYMLKYVERSFTTIPELEVMAFGRPNAKYLNYDLLSIDSWRPPFDRGLAFNKTTWTKIVALSAAYCMYDDSSWSYSLLNLFGKFPRGKVDMVACVAPRVIATGMFTSRISAMVNIQQQLEKASLFPKTVKAVALYERRGRVSREYKPPPHGNGGWSDKRDHQLCLHQLL